MASIASVELEGETHHLPPPVDVPSSSGDDPLEVLSAAEREVCELRARGLTAGQIARRRGSTAKTVENQLLRIHRKLRVGSRAELAARVAGF